MSVTNRVVQVTFDDEWRLDLRERRAWQCVRPARPHEWKGEDDSDDEADEEEDGEGDDSASGEDASDEDADGMLLSGARGGEIAICQYRCRRRRGRSCRRPIFCCWSWRSVAWSRQSSRGIR